MSNPAPPAALAAGSSAEVQAAAFAADDRIHYDRAAGSWRYEDEDGNEMEYDATKGAWVPVVCLMFMGKYVKSSQYILALRRPSKGPASCVFSGRC